jgi:hypothetical protein
MPTVGGFVDTLYLYPTAPSYRSLELAENPYTSIWQLRLLFMHALGLYIARGRQRSLPTYAALTTIAQYTFRIRDQEE